MDEIGDLAPNHQAKILRFLENGTYTPVGETKEKRVKVRVVAATNKDLLAEVQKGNFREDLYHRLAQFVIFTFPLAMFPEDVVCLVNHFSRIRKFKDEEAKLRFLLYAHSFPGNIRELKNLISAGYEQAFTKLAYFWKDRFRSIAEQPQMPEMSDLESPGSDWRDLNYAVERIEREISGRQEHKGIRGALFHWTRFKTACELAEDKNIEVKKCVRAYEVIVLHQNAFLTRESIAKTLEMSKKSLIPRQFKKDFGFEFPKNRHHYFVTHPMNAYPNPYDLRGRAIPGPDFQFI
jgi:transcriptional regulator with GAF, ATPase, and Fis domain